MVGTNLPESCQRLDFILLGLIAFLTAITHRVIRLFIWRMTFSIIYEEWPMVWYIDRIVKHIYLARSVGDFKQEEDMYARLLFLYRSHETMIKVTRPLKPDVAARLGNNMPL